MEAGSQANAWLAGDESKGPGNTITQFLDFTLVFENSLLSILPAACLILIFPFHVWRYSRPAKVALAGRLYWARLVSPNLGGRKMNSIFKILRRLQL